MENLAPASRRAPSSLTPNTWLRFHEKSGHCCITGSIPKVLVAVLDDYEGMAALKLAHRASVEITTADNLIVRDKGTRLIDRLKPLKSSAPCVNGQNYLQMSSHLSQIFDCFLHQELGTRQWMSRHAPSMG